MQPEILCSLYIKWNFNFKAYFQYTPLGRIYQAIIPTLSGSLQTIFYTSIC